MTTTMLKHWKCGGVVVMDISNRFSLSTPSFSISVDGISLGTMEVGEMEGSQKSVLRCKKCSSFLEIDDGKSVTAQCMFCRRYRPIDTLFVSYPFYSVCESCRDILTGEKGTENADLLEIMSLYLVPKETIKFVSMLEIFKKPIK